MSALMSPVGHGTKDSLSQKKHVLLYTICKKTQMKNTNIFCLEFLALNYYCCHYLLS